MRYSLKQILATRYDPNRSRARKIEERLIPVNALGKILSPYPTYIYLNLGLKPDHVTFISFFFIGAASYFFVAGEALSAVISLLLFLIHDSVDGDMARVRGATKYGAIMDSFGADIFYALIPVSVGFFLFTHDTTLGGIGAKYTLLVGALVSISFLLYRLINTKVLNFFWDKRGKGDRSVFEENKNTPPSVAQRFARIYRHSVFRGNFFAEPGMITWFSILVLAGWLEVLGMYLIAILLYNLGYLVPNFVRIYFQFLKYERK